MKEMERWYDKYEELGKHLDSFKNMKEENRDPLIKGIMSIVQQQSPELLACEKAFEFPLELHRRRWYDNDPYLWLLFNTLKSANKKVLILVVDYLNNSTGTK